MDELVLKSYKKKDVESFILELNEAHKTEISEKDNEIKRIFSECENYKSECEKKDEEIASLEKKYNESLEQKQKEVDEVKSRMGEKLLIAEKAASSIINEANAALNEAKAESERIKKEAMEEAKKEADEYLASVKEKANRLLCLAETSTAKYTETERQIEQQLGAINEKITSCRQAIDEMMNENRNS